MKKKGETRKVRTSFFLFHIRSSIKKHKKRKKGINPAPVAAPDGRVEQTVFFDFGPEENGTRSTTSTRTRGKTKRKTKTATTAYAVKLRQNLRCLFLRARAAGAWMPSRTRSHARPCFLDAGGFHLSLKVAKNGSRAKRKR